MKVICLAYKKSFINLFYKVNKSMNAKVMEKWGIKTLQLDALAWLQEQQSHLASHAEANFQIIWGDLIVSQRDHE